MTSSTPRRLIVLTTDPGYGGAEKSFAKTCELLAQHYKVFPVVFNKRIVQSYPLSIELLSLDVPPAESLIGKWISFVRRVRRLKRLKKKLNIDVCISFLEGADYVNYFSRGRDRTVMSVRGSKYFDFRIAGVAGFLRQKLFIPFILGKADRVIAVSKGVAKELIDHYHVNRNKVTVVENYYEPKKLGAFSSEPVHPTVTKFFSHHPVLIAVGRLSPEKGYHHLIRILADVRKGNRDTRLALVGEGDYVTMLIDACHQTNCTYAIFDGNSKIADDTAVLFLGYQPNPFPYVRAARLLVLSSLTEGFPNVLVEAMAIGTPTAAADCPYGPREILTGKNGEAVGLLLPALSDIPSEAITQEWRRKIVALLADPTQLDKFSRLGRSRVEDYTADRAISAWKNLIDAL